MPKWANGHWIQFHLYRLNLSMRLSFGFDEDITNKIDFEKINNIELNNFIIRDEENRIVYGGLKEEFFEQYCNKYGLDYKYRDFNENYKDNGINTFIAEKDNDAFRLVCNLNSTEFPKSKKLYITIGNMNLVDYKNNSYKEYKINGYWQVEINVPEEMYNRNKEYYKVVSCDNPDFDVYTASVSDTGFEIGIIISNIQPNPINDLDLKEYREALKLYKSGEISEEKYNEISLKFLNWNYYNKPILVEENNLDGNNIKSYLEDWNKSKYYIVQNATKKSKNYFLENNKFDFYQTFSLTKYDATDKITAILYYYGKPVIIELEKIK